MKLSVHCLFLFVSTSQAFSPFGQPKSKGVKATTSATLDGPNARPLFDPFGLYPRSSPERKKGLLQPLENINSGKDTTVIDPLNLYKDKSQVTAESSSVTSPSLPFLKRPEMLDGSLPGDRGFDPFNFSSNPEALQWNRNAEIKHARIAMLAAVGWPLAELFDKKIAYAFDLKPLLVFQDRVPSVLNGGLGRVPPAFWASVLGFTAAIEVLSILKEQKARELGVPYTPGDLGFDPFNLKAITREGRMYEYEAELFNGRLAMLAITAYAFQEWWTQNSVINATPFLFKPVSEAIAQMAEAASHSL